MKVRVQSARSGSVRSRARASMGRAVLLAVMLLAAACSAQDVAENIANQALEEEGISIDLDGDQITVDGPDGQVSVGQGLPADFPADFPLPQGADAQGGAGGAGRDVVAIFQADGSVEDVSEFFSAELPAAGYEITQSTGDGSTGQVYSVSGNGWTGEVAIGQSVGTSFTVSLDRQE